MRGSLGLLSLVVVGCRIGAQDEATGPNLQVDYDVAIPDGAEFAPDRIIVGFSGSAVPARIDLSSAHPVRQLVRQRELSGIGAGLFEVPAGTDIRQLVASMRSSGMYRWVEPDYVRTASANDTYRAYQWNLDAVNADSAWTYSTGSGVIVAVLDPGVTSGSAAGNGRLSSGYAYANSDSNAADDNGHGTHVAGTIAQNTDNSAGVAGLAYNATILPVKVLDRSGNGYTSDVVSGINYAVSSGASVINMSLGSSSYSSSEASAVANAYAAGVFVAAASGNSGSSSVDYPAGYSGAVAVGATTYGDTLTSYSSTGSAMDLVAPGGDTTTDGNGDGYGDGILQETFSGSSWGYYFFEGTSMATPHVAAAAALLMANGATNVEAESLLKSTASDLGSSGWDSSHGYGLIQPDAALAAYASGGGGGDTGSGDTGSGDTGSGGDTGDTGEVVDPCDGYDNTGIGTLSGSGDVLSTGSHTAGSGTTTHTALLSGPSGADFDLYLDKQRRGSWRTKASSTSTSSDESISYSGKKGTYRWRVESYSGSGDFTLCYTNP